MGILKFKTFKLPVSYQTEIGEANVYDVFHLGAGLQPVGEPYCVQTQYPGQPEPKMHADMAPARVANCCRTRPVYADGTVGEWSEWQLGTNEAE